MTRKTLTLDDILLLDAVGEQEYDRIMFRRRVTALLDEGLDPADIAKRLGKRATVYAIASEHREN